MHTTVMIGDNMYLWGGNQEGLPLVHDHPDKIKFTSSLHVFHVPTTKWEKRSTTGNPHTGIKLYSCSSIQNRIFYFGGNCAYYDCFHNDLFELNIESYNWREVVCDSQLNRPMKKQGSCMVSLNIDGKDCIMVLGGYGQRLIDTQTQFEYTTCQNHPNLCYTNEIHIKDTSSSSGNTFQL